MLTRAEILARKVGKGKAELPSRKAQAEEIAARR
jgi:hypothetical protein